MKLSETKCTVKQGEKKETLSIICDPAVKSQTSLQTINPPPSFSDALEDSRAKCITLRQDR